jgi:histidinol dehydrogenase
MRIERHELPSGGARELAGALRGSGRDREGGIAVAVAETVAAVARRGDAAVLELGERFDGVRPGSLRVPAEEVEAALAALDPELREALELSAVNIHRVASAQSPAATEVTLAAGQRVEVAEVPVGAAAVYAPGGRAPYPSTVLMGVIPALAAGVGRVVVASPPGPDGLPAAVVLAAAALAGAHEVYAMGGAQAVAALAHGPESVEPVDVIAGPGSPWVQEAKLQCSRLVGIDGYAGPSELMVVCDSAARAEWVALDVCAQAEHGDDGLLVVTGSAPLLDEVAAEVERVAAANPSVHDAALALVAADVEPALELSEALAPEHLELACVGAEELARRVTTAGCVFTGPEGGAAFGDYSAGSNHVLPTGGAGRFTGPLGPSTFRRRISRVAIGPEGARGLAPTVATIAAAEGFPVHGESTTARAAAPVVDPAEPAS